MRNLGIRSRLCMMFFAKDCLDACMSPLTCRNVSQTLNENKKRLFYSYYYIEGSRRVLKAFMGRVCVFFILHSSANMIQLIK